MNIERIRTKELEWMDIPGIAREEGDFLQKRYNFHPLDISDCLSVYQAPKIDLYDDYIFIIFNFPHYNKQTTRIEVDELKIFVREKTIITIHKPDFKPIESLFQNCKNNIHIRSEFLGKDTGYFLYRVLHILSKNMFPVLDKIGEALQEVEKSIYEGETRDVVMDLAVTRRNILSLRKIISPQRLILQTLINAKKSFLGHDVEVYFGDILDKFERAYVSLTNHHDLVKGFNETNEALISHKTNDVMKILTVISVTLLPLTLMASIYGMNVHLPLANNPAAFWIILFIMILIIGLTLAVFRKRNIL